MAAQRQTRRALLASVVAVPLLAARAARAEGGEVKDTDIRALMLSTVLMGVAGFTAVGAASTPMGGAPLLLAQQAAHASSHARACTDEGHEHH